jgi:hypothetical protein
MTTQNPTRRRTVARARLGRAATTTAAIATCLALGLSASAGAANTQLEAFELAPQSAAAGAHSDVALRIEQKSSTPEELFGGRTPDQLAKNIAVDLPPGLLADPTATPTCSAAQLNSPVGCPDDTQVGLLRTDSTGYGEQPTQTYPVFNMTRRSDQVARLGAPAITGASAVVYFDVRIREESDYGATATLSDVPSSISFWQARVDLWGAPKDASHDAERSSCQTGWASGSYTPGCTAPLAGPVKPFMVNPTRCDAPLGGHLRMDFYETPGVFSDLDGAPLTPTDCASVPFAPTLT